MGSVAKSFGELVTPRLFCLFKLLATQPSKVQKLTWLKTIKNQEG